MLPSSLFAGMLNSNGNPVDSNDAESAILNMLRTFGGQSLVDTVTNGIAEENARRQAMQSAPCAMCRSTGVLRLGFRPEPPKPRRRNGKLITPVLVQQEVQFEDYNCPQCQGTNFGFPKVPWETAYDASLRSDSES